MRNNEGHWVAGFSCMTKTHNSDEAECWTLLQAIKWAWSEECKRVWFQCDSKTIVEWVNTSQNPMGPLGDMVRACKSQFEKPWDMRISHVSREQNALADAVAKIFVTKICDWIEFDAPPSPMRFVAALLAMCVSMPFFFRTLLLTDNESVRLTPST